MLVDPEGLPGVLVARILVTLEGLSTCDSSESSSNAGGHAVSREPPRLWSNRKSSLVELVDPPPGTHSKLHVLRESDLGTGAGEDVRMARGWSAEGSH